MTTKHTVGSSDPWPRTVACLLIAACLLVAAGPGAHAATKRILLVGDSWTQFIWKDDNLKTVLNNWGLGPATSPPHQYEDEGAKTAISGSTAEAWADNSANPLDLPLTVKQSLANELAANPTIDIIHLCLGGNDLHFYWRYADSPAQQDIVYNQIAADVANITNYILSLRKDVKVAIAGYDYVNLYDLAWDAGNPGSDAALVLIALMGLPFWPPDLVNGDPNVDGYHEAFAEMERRKKDFAVATPRVEYVHNFGVIQHREGYSGNFGSFGPLVAPFPDGAAGNYANLPGGNFNFPTDLDYMDNGTDPIHLSETGYNYVLDNCVYQYYAAWLTDTTNPEVLSITRAGSSPTAAASVDFVVTFSKPIQAGTLGIADFTIDSADIWDASVTAVNGSGDTWTVTVATGTTDGSLSIDFVDRDTVYDATWRLPGGLGQGNANFAAGETYVVDRTDPQLLSITPQVPVGTNQNSMVFDVLFSENVTGFTESDVQAAVVVGMGTAQVTGLAGSGTAYSFTVQVNRTDSIEVDIDIPIGAGTDAAGRNTTSGHYDNYQFLVPPGPGDPYQSNGSNGDLVLSGSPSIAIDTGNGALNPTLQVDANPAIAGELITVGGETLAKFNFGEVNVPNTASVSVTGSVPLSLAATEDMYWGANVDVSGALAGRCGGGLGGGGGDGGDGGGGGGGDGGGSGGPDTSGGGGAPNVGDNYGNGLGAGQTGPGRNAGGDGSGGTAGDPGEDADPGGPGGVGFGAVGTAGSGGNNNGTGGSPNTRTNYGAGDGSSGGGGGHGTYATCPPATSGNPGGGGASGNRGGAASYGASGGNGTDGSAGGNAALSVSANDLTIAAGHGGGGGRGGGGGAGGQGGGGGGGGSSGAGGGGGGLGWTSHIGQCNVPLDGPGGTGGGGGAGGNGGFGGSGGTAQPGSNGGQGGQGGGAVILATRGLLEYGGVVDISSSAPASGQAHKSTVSGFPGLKNLTNSASGAGGTGGGAGYWWLDFIGCHINGISGGVGGSGGTSGPGGDGGDGGSSGESGAGGDGGLGTPGMVKVQGSVVRVNGGQVFCNNHTSITSSNLAGRFTVISNMASPPTPPASDTLVAGSTRNDPVLRAPAPYNAALDIPLIPQLQGGPATSGLLAPSFDYLTYVPGGIDRIELIEFRGAQSVFDGFDQIMLVNNGYGDVDDVVLTIGGIDFELGTLPDGETWTTCVSAGLPVNFRLPTEVTITPADANLYVNDLLHLTANVTGGAGSPAYQWLKNGTGAPGLDNFQQYQISQVALGDAGMYTVEVTDGGPVVPSLNEVVVTVSEPLTITDDPDSATVETGETVIFNVAVSGGLAPVHYEWRKNGGAIPGAPDAPSFGLPTAQPSEAGTYTCIVSDSAFYTGPNALVSADAVLTVLNPLELTGPVSAWVRQGGAHTFEVFATGGAPGYRYVWKKNGQPLGAPDQSTYAIVGANPATHTGAYSVTVTDGGGTGDSIDSAVATLAVVGTLEIVTHPQSASRYPGQSVTFAAVVAGGIPPLQYLWERNGTPVPDQPLSPVYTVDSVVLGDNGAVYTLTVSDAGSPVESLESDPALLSVGGSPITFTEHPQGTDRYTDQGDYTMTVATTGGLGSVTYEWLFDDGTGPLSVGTGAAHTITSPQLSNSGSYNCEASDDVSPFTGAVVSDMAAVRFGERLAFTEHPAPALRYVDQGSYTLTVVTTGGLGTLDYAWYLDHGTGALPVPLGAGSSYTVSNPAESDTGWYFCAAEDDLGPLDSDTAYVVFGPRLAIDSQPQGGEVNLGGTFTFTVEATGGVGGLTYAWLFETPEKAWVPVGGDSPALVITNATPEHEGTYQVTISDDIGSETSEDAYLSVGAAMPISAFAAAALLGVLCTFGCAVVLRRRFEGHR